jgi:hypothetical protein
MRLPQKPVKKRDLKTVKPKKDDVVKIKLKPSAAIGSDEEME